MSLEDAVIAGNEDELTKLTLRAMRAADTARQLWAVATLGPLKEATLGEDVFPPEVLDCVVERALTFTKSADRASAISLAARITTFSPVALVDKDASIDDKPSLLDALKKHRDKFCAELSSSQASVRAAAALTLGRCGHKGDADLLMLKFGSGAEAGARLVAAAALGASVSEQAERFLADKNLVTRTCAACAIGLVSELDGEACDVLADAMVSKQKLPSTWGWRWRFGTSGHTGTMAATLLRHSKASEPSRIVDALSGLEELDQASADVLGRLAFASPPKLGVTMEDLDDAGRNALRALCRVERGVQVRSTVHRLGLPSVRHIEELIDEHPPFFATTNVLVGGQAKRWHVGFGANVRARTYPTKMPLQRSRPCSLRLRCTKHWSSPWRTSVSQRALQKTRNAPLSLWLACSKD